MFILKVFVHQDAADIEIIVFLLVCIVVSVIMYYISQIFVCKIFFLSQCLFHFWIWWVLGRLAYVLVYIAIVLVSFYTKKLSNLGSFKMGCMWSLANMSSFASLKCISFTKFGLNRWLATWDQYLWAYFQDLISIAAKSNFWKLSQNIWAQSLVWVKTSGAKFLHAEDRPL